MNPIHGLYTRCIYGLNGLAIAILLLAVCPINSIAQTTPIRGVSGDNWADVILGQSDFSQMSMNTVVANRVARPGGVFVDRVSSPNRLYVFDAGNNRILGFSNVGVLSPNQSVTTGVTWAPDIVLGQTDFTHMAANGDSQLQDFPGYNFAAYLSSTDPLPNPTASSLNLLDPRVVSPGESGSYATMAVDSQGNLYVPDYYNNRVLCYTAPTYTGEAASYEWGQPDFNSYRPNQGGSATNGTFSFMNQRGFLVAGVCIDQWGNLWVTDTGNDRVMRFPNQSAPAFGVPAATADVILGVTGVPASNDLDMTHFYYPGSVRVDPAGDVFVADGPPASNPSKTQGGRILIFKPQSYNGSGVPQYTNDQTPNGSVTNGLTWPTGLEFDPSGDLWVNDFGNTQVILYHMNLSAVPPTGTPTKLLLRSQFYPGVGSSLDAITTDNSDFNYAYPVGSVMSGNSPEYHHDNWGGLGVDSAGDVFVSSTDPIIDIMRYPAPIPSLTTSGSVTAVNLPGFPNEAHAPDVAVFKNGQDPDTGGINNVVTNTSVGALGLVIGYTSSVTQLIAAEGHRMDYWNLDTTNEPSCGLVNGKAIDGFAGTTASTVNYMAGEDFSRICTDQATGQPHLWATHGDPNNLWVEVYNLPLTPWQTGAVSITFPIPILGGGSFNCGSAGNRRMDGIAVDPTGSYLWLSDTINNRVFRVRNPLGVSPNPTPVVDIILGQTSAAATLANQGGAESSKTLNQPGAVTYDHHGNLYVSDFSLEANGNARLLEFDAATVQNSSTTSCLYDVAASHVYAENGNMSGSCVGFSNPSLSPCGPWQPAFRSDDQVMVLGTMGYTGSRWPVVFYNPLTNFNQPTTFMNDFMSMGAYSGVFDNQGNYYLTDPDRGKVIVYWQPFPTNLSPTVTPTPTTDPTPNLTVTNTSTSTPTNTPTITPTSNCSGCSFPQVTYGTGVAGSANGQMNGNSQLAVGTTNGTESVYFADINNNRIDAFNAGTGAFENYYTGVDSVKNPNGLTNPYGVALSSDGRYLFAACTNGAEVVKMDLMNNGAVSAVIPVSHPVYVTLDPATGDVYSGTDASVTRFHEQTPNNYVQEGVLGTVGTTGSGPNQFNGSYAVLVQNSGNTVYVADSNNGRIMEWTWSTITSSYSYAATVYSGNIGVMEIAVDPSNANHVYVGTSNDGYVIMDMTTTPWTVVYQCNPEGQQYAPGIGVDLTKDYHSLPYQAKGDSFSKATTFCMTPVVTATPTITNTATTTPTNTITPTFTNTPTLSMTNSPTNTATNTATSTSTSTATNTMSYTPTLTSTITSTNTLTSIVTNTSTPVCNACTTILMGYGTGTQGTAPNQIYNSRGIANDGTYLYVANGVNRDVRKFTIGNPSTSVSFTDNNGFTNVWGVALDGNGHLFVADIDGNQVVELMASTGAPVTSVSFTHPLDVAVDSLGNVFAINQTQIMKWTGGLSGTGTVIGTQNNATGITALGTMIYVADTNNNTVDQWTGSGTSYTETVVANLAAGSNPRSVAFDPSGKYAYVVENANRMEIFTTTTLPWTQVGVCSGNGINEPAGVWVDGNGDIYVSQTQGFVVDEYAPPPCVSVITFTPTPTNTATPTATNTATNSVTNTATNTVTNSPTVTYTPTFSMTNTASATSTNTTTDTATNTTTNTATNTTTDTATNTSTPTSTFTATQTSTGTGTPSMTNTATNTPTSTNTNTTTLTSTNTPTNTSTTTSTNTWTNTPTPTSTSTNTDTFTATYTATKTNTSTATLTLTMTKTVTPTATKTSTLVTTKTLTPTATRTFTQTFTATITKTLTKTPTPTFTFTITPTPTISMCGTSSADLELLEFAGVSGNQADETFEILNNGTTSVNLSDLTIKFWVNDTSYLTTPSLTIDPVLFFDGNYGPSKTGATGENITATVFAPACGPTSIQQANWEITLSNTSTGVLSAGSKWTNIQASLHLGSSYAPFSPGTGTWYSPASVGGGTSYTNNLQYALYYRGNLVTVSGGVPPICRPLATCTPSKTSTNNVSVVKATNQQGITGFGPNLTPTETYTVTCSPTVTPTIGIATSGPPILYPNPWNGTTPEKLHVYLRYATRLEVKIYDLSYRKVQDTVLTQVPAGWNDITLQLQDISGQTLPDGLYYVSISTNWVRTINKLLILK